MPDGAEPAAAAECAPFDRAGDGGDFLGQVEHFAAADRDDAWPGRRLRAAEELTGRMIRRQDVD